ncbi:MAG: hypothetical protein U0T75_15820 [Chitinophagales bacterium]
MKKMLFVSLLAASFAGKAQSALTVQDTVRPFLKGNLPAYQVDIPETKGKEIDKTWSNYLKKLSKEKSRSEGDELIVGGVLVKNISPNPLTVYSKTLETQNGVRLTAAFELDSLHFISPRTNADQDLAAKKFLRDYAVLQYRAVAEKQLADEQDRLKELKNKLDGFIKKEEKAVKSIEEKKRSIGRNQDAIKSNEADLKVKNEALEGQKRTVEAAKTNTPEALKAEEKKLKEQESERNKLIKTGEKLHGDIDDWNADIRAAERDIDEARQNQKVTNDQIDKQKKAVNQAEDKVKGIK